MDEDSLCMHLKGFSDRLHENKEMHLRLEWGIARIFFFFSVFKRYLRWKLKESIYIKIKPYNKKFLLSAFSSKTFNHEDNLFCVHSL